MPLFNPLGISVSAGASSDYLDSVVFSNSNGVSFGLAGSTITASAGAGGGGNNTLGMSNLGNTSGTTGVVTGQAVQVVFAGGNNVTLSQSINGSSATITISAGNGGAGAVKSRFNPWVEAVAVVGQVGQQTLHVHPVPGGDNFQFDRVLFDVMGTQATNSNSSGSFTVSMWAGIYTRNASTLSMLASASTTHGITVSGTVRSSLNNGARLMSLGWTSTMTHPDLWMGVVSRTTSGGANLYTLSQFVGSEVNSNFSGQFGQANNATNQNLLGLGIYTATTSAIPASIAFSQLNGTASAVQRVPLYYFLSQTA